MPKLKQLHVQGFKSFADPLSLVYPTGVTAIVGPNGSGKSNVSDAIRWVLGEQSMRSLRGRSGEDMIFAGSKRRARAGMARVSLTFDNTDQWLPVEFSEVTIERCTYRDGKTDYLLNGSKVRLMDLRDILGVSGLGRDAYLFIGQGLVDKVLSLRPRERLALFEQASGIAPYRDRREDALKRLEETQRNLDRVRDIVGEIEPRLRHLKRQADKAEQHQELTKALNETLMIWYGYRWGQALTELDAARQRVTYREEQALRHLENVDALESEVTGLRHTIVEKRAHLAELHREGSQRHAEAESVQRDLAVAIERRRSLQERLEEARSNLNPLHSALEAGEEERSALKSALAGAQEQLQAARAQLADSESAYRKVEQQRHILLRQQSESQSQALESRHRLADRQSRLEQLQERAVKLEQQIASLKAELEAATERRREQQRAVETARRELESAEEALNALEARDAQLRAREEAARVQVERLRREIATKQADYQKLAARLEALERLHAEGTGLYAGVRAVLQAVERGHLSGLEGTVASLIHVPSQLDLAMETALGSQLQHVITQSWDDAKEAIAWLKKHRAGRATFLPLDTLRPSSPLSLPPVNGIMGVGMDLVQYDARFEPAVQLLLGRVAVAEDLSAARVLHSKLRGGFQIVTLEGELLRSSGSLTGGEDRNQRGGSLLARERERRELPDQVETLLNDLKGLRNELREAEDDLAQSSQALSELGRERRTVGQQRQQAQRQLDSTVRELESLVQKADWQQQRLEESVTEQSRLGESRTRLEQERQEATQALEQAETALQKFGKELQVLENDETSGVVAAHRTQVALREQEHENSRVLLETRVRELQRLSQQIQGQESRIRSMAATLQGLSSELDGLQSRYEQAREAAEALTAQIPPLEEEVAGLEKSQAEHETKESKMRHILREAEQRLSKAEMDANRREDQIQTLRREIEESLGIVVGDLPETISAQQPLPLSAIVSPLPKVEVLPEGLEQQIRDLRTQIRRLEPINPEAQSEYDEVSERHGFLREQTHDLETASAHLQQIIAELDEMMDETFRTTFKAISSEFTRIFKMLFNGGTAKLNLQDGDDEIAGVEITARPPGKRTSGLGMLSGGERTLTAVALLFAVLLVSPTPFCILDEVDAMLDEANVGRFRAMLRELSKETQFLIITHNRGTVEVADTIYGVSMGDDGVSQVLSLSIEDLPASEKIDITSQA